VEWKKLSAVQLVWGEGWMKKIESNFDSLILGIDVDIV
jgi:hypothetical protein